MEAEVDEERRTKITLILRKIIQMKLGVLNDLKFMENPLSSIAGLKEIQSKEKRINYLVKFNDEELGATFMAGKTLDLDEHGDVWKPREGTDFRLRDKYGSWEGALDRDGNITYLKFNGKSEFGKSLGYWEDLNLDGVE